MSLRARRNSLLKSSISLNSMRDSIAKFNKGLKSAQKNAFEIVKRTKESNAFKRTLIASDNNFFRKRQENVRRKDREDEIEAVSLSGAVKQKGTILAKSTRGFLGRLLDFVGILLVGWALTNLPKIIAALSGLIKMIRSVTRVLGFFINAIKDIVVGIGTVISEALSKIPFFDYEKNKKSIEENLDRSSSGLLKLDQQLVQSGNEFTEFGDEVEAQLENEIALAENEGSIEGQKDDNSVDNKEGENIKATTEEIGFGIDSLIKTQSESQTEDDNELDDSIDNLNPQRKPTNNLQVEEPNVDTKKIVEEEVNKQKFDGKKSIEDEFTDKVKGLKQQTEPELIQKVDSKRKIDLSDARESVNNIQKNISSEFLALKTDGEMLENVKSPVKSIKPMLRDRSRSVRGKRKRKGDTIFIVEKQVPMMSNQMMASAGKAKLNITEQLNNDKTLMKLQSASSLKYT
tara:strand:- start:161 stop:1537 length:1377 start_codon:yes stop_codon:yes gene_type:complete